ncbi:hypothetical protein F400_gp125 [Bacillus phage BCD7]|uniref:Uncharacterized protein n=1 Tax=Bacillus phage BCD7 TaxID=1136534 RepID=J9PUE5_9CAUD|nr:hypothetical protein F400_gp125 [Bacillus phage BCD7]AEZ50572.1 hypothetical protein BCD7_0125 [Bacillus phage BCD7]
MSEKRKEIVGVMNEILKVGVRTDIRHEYEKIREAEKEHGHRGVHLQETPKKVERSITFAMRLGIGDKAVHVYDGSLTPCIITGINNISLKDGDVTSGEFGINYKIRFLHNGMESTAFSSMLLTTEEAIDHFMVFASIQQSNVKAIIDEYKEK